MSDEDEPAPPKPSAIAKIVPFVLVLAVGMAGGYGVSMVLGSGKAEASTPGGGEAPEAPAGEHGQVAAAAPTSGIVNLGVFTVNLRGSGGGRVLRTEVQLEARADASATIDAHSAHLRDAIITAASDYTWAELEGVDGKTRLRDELLARLNGIVAPHVVDRVYFTQFVVQ
jgi:flagellar basal body-associated protein FliL